MRVVQLGRFGGPAVDFRATAQAGAWQAGRGPFSAAGPNGWLWTVALQLDMRISEAILSKFECFHMNVKFISLFKF
jgi:hypothetical protein